MEDRFHLAVGDVLQGEMTLRSRTLLLVFQVNCPGCFSYALPLAEAIHQDRNRLGLAVMGLSTAFEDFNLNTAAHTRDLLERGTVYGETARSLGSSTYSGSISFPIAVDAGMERGIGETFAENRLRGTPSWLLLEPNGALLAHYFGQLQIEILLNVDGAKDGPES